MNFARARRIPIDSIPVIDIAALVAGEPEAELRAAESMSIAANEVGFFYVRNHGVPQDLIDAAFRVSRAFFESPLELKNTVPVSAKKRGYIEKYIPHVAIALQEILGFDDPEKERVIQTLTKTLERSRSND